ncbi:MAG: FG-GAP repeat domain-containing protein [Bacteroidota bacterium]
MLSPEEKNVSGKEKNFNDNTSAVSTTFGESRFTARVKIVLCILLLPLFGYSQLRPLTSIAVVQEFSLPDFYRFPTFIHYSDGKRSDLIAYDVQMSELVLLIGSGRGDFPNRKVLASLPQPSSLFTGDINNDGIGDIALVLREQNKVIILTSNKSDSTYQNNSFTVNYYPEKVIFGDISGDNINDIVIFGKLSSGVTVVRGKKGNAFHNPETIFLSVPVSDLSIISLNADKIPDLVVRKWLSNEDVFYFGIGDLQFSEQTTLSYGEDSVLSACHDLNGDNITDVVVASTQLGALLIYHGDGLGNLSRVQIIELQNNIIGLTIGLVHSNSYVDIITRDAGERNFSIMINTATGQYYDEIVFGMPYARNIIGVCDINGDGYDEIVLMDASSGRYTIAWNGHTERLYSKDDMVLVGNDPSGLSVTDLNADGVDDILVSNSGSNTISILMGSQTKAMHEQLSVETAKSPTNVTVYSHHDTAVTLLTVHSNELLIGVITLHSDGKDRTMNFHDADLYTIPLTGKPSYVLPDMSIYNKSVSMYVFSKTIPNGITFYQQLQTTKFVAKNLTLQVPSRIIFSTISDLNNDGLTDLIYMYHDQKKKRDFLGTTLNDLQGDFTGMSYSYILPDTGLSRAFLYVEDINGDQQKDFILYDHADNTITMILGKNDGDFSTLIKIPGEFPVENIHQIQILDFDADGINDIIYRDAVTKTLFVVKGKGNGYFFPKRSLIAIPDGSMFRCGDVNGDGAMDVVYTHPVFNAISIRYGY